MSNINDEQMIEYYNFLEELRNSGKVNMFEAPQHLEDNFGLSPNQCLIIFAAWCAHKQEQARKEEING